MAHFEAYIHKLIMGILVDAHSKQKNEPEQFKHALLEFLVMILAQLGLNFFLWLGLAWPGLVWSGLVQNGHLTWTDLFLLIIGLIRATIRSEQKRDEQPTNQPITRI